MRIGILSRRPDLYSTRRLLEAGKARGHNVEIIDFSRCYMNITSSTKSIHYYGKILPRLDAVIPRISTASTFYGSSVVRQLETMGTYTINPSISITRSRDKLRSLQILSMHQIGLPITGFANSTADIQDLIKMIGGTPLIIKVLEGTQGVGVVLAETKKAAESVIQAFLGSKQNIIIQEFIKEAKGADIRCLVIGERVVASMKRQAAPGEFRSNIHRGGVAELIEITKEERMTAIKAAKVMGLRLAGVDLLQSDRGPLVMEVNSSPGLEGIETATGEDIAAQVIEYLEKHAKPLKKGSRYEG